MNEITGKHIEQYMHSGMYFAGRTAEFKNGPLPIDIEEMYLEYVSLSLANVVGTKVDSVNGFMFRLFKNAFKMAVRYCRAEKRGSTLYVKEELTDSNLLQFGSIDGGEGVDEIVHHDEVKASSTGYPVQQKFEQLLQHFSVKDLSIIDLMLAGSKQSEIADDLDINLNDVKYTMRKLKAFGYTKPAKQTYKPMELPKQTLEGFYLSESSDYDSWTNAKLIVKNDE
jgi:DNA-binding CsgD family transcriptional regulator